MVRPETLKNGKRIGFIEPDCPSEVRPIVTRVYDAELASASSEDILIFVSRFEARSAFHFAPDVIDDLVHDIEVESEDNDFGMLVGMEQAAGVSELRPFVAFAPEDLGHSPTVGFNVGEEPLISRVQAVPLAKVARHALQSSTGSDENLIDTHPSDARL